MAVHHLLDFLLLLGGEVAVEVVDGGDVVQQGVHDTLIAQEGLYRQMYLSQFE